ncbi:MAG: endolytic transglycosylase MltG [Pseudomonadota bacterium]
MHRLSCEKSEAGGLGSRGFIRWFLALVLLALAGVAGSGAYLYKQLTSEGPLLEEQVLWIERGNGMETVTGKLADMGALTDERIFTYFAKATDLGAELRAGEFAVPAGASMLEIVEIIQSAKPILHYVTIPEGRTVVQTFALINAEEILEGEISLEVREGELLPETYAFQRGDTADDLVQRMVNDHYTLLEELWPLRADNLPFNTMEEAVILASIVEKETALAEERPRVAAVFVNRLSRGMRLQSDPTIIYGLTGGEPLGRGIRQSELRGETPYNTYVIRGLPPTPIANPGRASIAAVLNPAQTNDLYFVADGTGGHVFASTLREHNQNVAAWRRIERARAQQ